MPLDDRVQSQLESERVDRAEAIRAAGGLEAALAGGSVPRFVDTTLSEALVLGLLRQGVCTFVGVLGHGCTEIGNVLRIYEQAGLVQTYGVRSEIEASHAAAALRWVTGQKAAVITSIGPGALHALAASLVPASEGLGVWYLMGDETTEDEGPNMQGVQRGEQEGFLRLFSAMGSAYRLHTPWALPSALRRGLNVVDHPHRASPFYLLLPMNTQSSPLAHFRLDELPLGAPPRLGPAADDGAYEAAVAAIARAERVVVRVGGGAREAGPELLDFLDLARAVAVTSPVASGVIPYGHELNMTVGGSKDSISGNYAMGHADLLVAVGTRSVCQSDCSRTGYPLVERVISINTDIQAALHYNRTIPLVGDAGPTLRKLNEMLAAQAVGLSPGRLAWLEECRRQRQAWESFKALRYAQPTLFGPVWGAHVLTQPAAIKTAADWARAHDVVCLYDAGDVQANAFQIVEDERPGRTFTETGASYMGFAVSALLSTALATKPFYALAFSGDGSLTMSPQILIDAVQHGARGCILLLDNRRMAAITGLQVAQYGAEHATHDAVATDYVAWAGAVPAVRALEGGRSVSALVEALERAYAYPGLSLVHVPVYYGQDELGGMGVFGRWNVGSWCTATQALRHEIGL